MKNHGSKKDRALMLALPLAVVLGSVAPAAAVILLIVLELLTLFSVVGLTFATHADVRAVADPPADVESCDIVISILDEHGQILDSVQARVPSGEMVTLQYTHLFGAVPKVDYDVVFVPFDGGAEVVVGTIRTNPAGNGQVHARDVFKPGTRGVGEVVIKRDGLDQFVTAFRVVR